MKLSTIFRAVHRRMKECGVDNGNSPYICDNVRTIYGFCTPDSDRARAYVDGLLGQHFCLEEWIRVNGYAEFRSPYYRVRNIRNTDLTDDQKVKMHATRLAWLEWMIADCESRGD